MTNADVQPQLTTAFYAQSVISFGVSLTGAAVGICYLPADPWMRGFLALSLLYVVTSTFTLAKCVRDNEQQSQVAQRAEQVRLERLFTEHDPFRSPA
jgi:hypothetical protein